MVMQATGLSWTTYRRSSVFLLRRPLWCGAGGYVLEGATKAGGFGVCWLGTGITLGRMWAWVRIDPSAISIVALSPNAKAWRPICIAAYGR